jgi:retron-type reverse transcriptase
MMKTRKDIYGKACSHDNLKLAFRKAKKGKRQRGYIKNFEADLVRNLKQLQYELEGQTYEPRPLRVFVIRDPKTRLISAPHFRDRVVHHALCNVIEPIFDRIFIHNSYASRKGKGTHAALQRPDRFKRKASCNGRKANNAKDTNMIIGYALKCDIRHYFASVDHEILMRIIGRKIKDTGNLWLIGRILESNEPGGRGMPIGALTSQVFANIYLNGLDYFVKHCLKAKYYIRYMDDFMILHKSKDALLAWKNRIMHFLLSELKLELHPEKSRIYPLHAGIGMLGYRTFYHYKLLRKSNIRTIEKRIADFRRMYAMGEISWEKIMQSIESWLAYARYANTYNLRKDIMKQFNATVIKYDYQIQIHRRPDFRCNVRGIWQDPGGAFFQCSRGHVLCHLPAG